MLVLNDYKVLSLGWEVASLGVSCWGEVRKLRDHVLGWVSGGWDVEVYSWLMGGFGLVLSLRGWGLEGDLGLGKG